MGGKSMTIKIWKRRSKIIVGYKPDPDMLLAPLWWEIINNEKVARGKRGCGRGEGDNILGDGLSLFSHCPRMIGFLFAFSSPLFLHSFLLLLCCETLLYFSCVILWLDLGLCCCLSQFVHFVWQEKGERENFLASNFPPRSFFYEWGWVESGLH